MYSSGTTPQLDLKHGTFAKYKALVFDCYGTLIDWETGIYDGLRPLFASSGQPTDRRTVINAFQSVERDLQAQHPSMPYTDLLAKVYHTLEARLQDKPTPTDALRSDDTSAPVRSSAHGAVQVDPAPAGTSASTQGGGETQTDDPAQAFAQSIGAWPPFPDTVPALASLSKRLKLVILSNIDNASIARTRALLEGTFTFDAVYTAQDVGAYKPAPEMLTYALAHLRDDFGIAEEEVLMTAQSVFHDIVPARERGLATAWINRAGAITGHDGIKSDGVTFTFADMGAMADVIERTIV